MFWDANASLNNEVWGESIDSLKELYMTHKTLSMLLLLLQLDTGTWWHIILAHHQILSQIQTSIVSSVLDSALPDCAKVFIQGQITSCTVYTTSWVTVDGTDYAPGMFVSVVDCLSSGGLMKSFLSITLCHCYAVHLSHGMLNMYALMSIHQCQGHSLFFRFQIRMTW